MARVAVISRCRMTYVRRKRLCGHAYLGLGGPCGVVPSGTLWPGTRATVGCPHPAPPSASATPPAGTRGPLLHGVVPSRPQPHGDRRAGRPYCEVVGPRRGCVHRAGPALCVVRLSWDGDLVSIAVRMEDTGSQYQHHHEYFRTCKPYDSASVYMCTRTRADTARTHTPRTA